MVDDERLSKPHDRLFKKALGIEIYMAEFLEVVLPEELTERFAFSTLRGNKDSFIDEESREHRTDLLFDLELADGEGTGYVYCLFEHKSYQEKWTALKLLDYMVRIWREDTEENDELPVILPIVFYHGEVGWNAPASLQDLAGPGIKAGDNFFPDYEFILLDMDELVAFVDAFSHSRIRLYLRALDLVRLMEEDRRTFERVLFNYFDELGDTHWDDKWEFEKFGALTFRYVLEQAPEEKAEEIITGAAKMSSERSDLLMSVADKLRREGKREGKKEGKREGKREEALEVALNLLEKKLQTDLSAQLQKELEDASYEKLKEVQNKLFDLESEDDVFELLEVQK